MALSPFSLQVSEDRERQYCSQNSFCFHFTVHLYLPTVVAIVSFLLTKVNSPRVCVTEAVLQSRHQQFPQFKWETAHRREITAFHDNRDVPQLLRVLVVILIVLAGADGCEKI